MSRSISASGVGEVTLSLNANFRLGIIRGALSVAKTMKAKRNGTKVQNEQALTG